MVLLTDLQKAFLRNYLNAGAFLPGGAPTEADHVEAGVIWDQIAQARQQADALRLTLANLGAPDHADATETAAVATLVQQATHALAAPLTEANALEAVTAARDLQTQAEAAITLATQRISAALKAWDDAHSAAQDHIATATMNALQQEAVDLAFTAIGTPAPDLHDTDALISQLADLQKRVDLIADATAAGLAKLAASKTMPDKLHKAEAELITSARAKAQAAVDAILDASTLKTAEDELATLNNAIAAGIAAATQRADLRVTLEAALNGLTAPDAATDVERKAIDDPATAARLLLTGDPDAAALQVAILATTEAAKVLVAANTRIKDARALWDAGVTGIQDSLTAPRSFPLAQPQTAAVQSLITAAQDLLAKDLSNVQTALAALKAPTDLYALLTGAVDQQNADLAKVAALASNALAAESAKYTKAKSEAEAAIAAAIDTPGIKQAAAKIAALTQLAAAITDSVDKRKDLFATVGKDKLDAACTAFGSVEAIDAIVGAIKPDASGLFDDTKITAKDLAALYKDALAGDPVVLAAVFQTGFAGDATQLNTFAASLSKDDRQRVSDMITQGGFDKAPQALGALVKLPGGTDKLKELGITFNDAPALATLHAGVTQGGLGGASARSPDVLASVLTDGVATAAELKKHLDGFGPGGMGDMRAMLSAFDGVPPPSMAGKAFAKVAAQVCPPDAGMKTQFFDTLDRSSAMSGAEKAQQKIATDPSVTLAAKAIGRIADPIAEAGLGVTLAGVAALQAGEGIPGVDAAQRSLLEQAIKASGTATVAMADAARLGADKPAAKAAADAALDPSDAQAATKANTAATAAGNAADLAKDALAAVTPPTADLLDKAAVAAKNAVAAAKLAPDDAVRDAVLVQAQACFDAIKTATTTLGKAVADDAQTAAQANALTQSAVEGPKVTGAAVKKAAVTLYQDQVNDGPARILAATDKRDKAVLKETDTDQKLTVAENKILLEQAKLDAANLAPNRATNAGKQKITKAIADVAKAVVARDKAQVLHDKAVLAVATTNADLLQEQTTYAAAPANLTAAQLADTPQIVLDRSAALIAIQTASDQAEASRNAKLIADDPLLAAAFAKAARLQTLADTPEATAADHLAAAEAGSDAAAQIATAASGPAVVKTGALLKPDLSGTVDATTPFTSAADVISAALSVKQALALAVTRQEKARSAQLAQERLVLDAQEAVTRFGPVDPYAKTLTAEKLKLTAKEADCALAATSSATLASAAKDVEDSLTKTIGVHNKVLPTLAALDPTRPPREAELLALQEAAAMIVLVLSRSYSAGYPAMNRDQLLSVASTMTKAPLVGMTDADPLAGTDAIVDMKHFCGRHTREFCSFEGRDLSDYDEAMDSAILQTQRKGVAVADLAPGERSVRDSRAQMKTTSMWPGGFGKADMEACLTLAIAEVEALIAADPPNATATVRDYIDLPDAQRVHKGTQFPGLAITHNTVNFAVQIAFKADSGDATKYIVSQFFPTNTPSVPFADMHALKSAMKH
ncbi:MAG: hypothetical protein ACOH2H_02830 [Cypionkella sp.]